MKEHALDDLVAKVKAIAESPQGEFFWFPSSCLGILMDAKLCFAQHGVLGNDG
jgi:hypothetical protein